MKTFWLSDAEGNDDELDAEEARSGATAEADDDSVFVETTKKEPVELWSDKQIQ